MARVLDLQVQFDAQSIEKTRFEVLTSMKKTMNI